MVLLGTEKHLRIYIKNTYYMHTRTNECMYTMCVGA